jgi:hypothetical protein
MQPPLERGSAPTRWADPAAQILASLHLCGFNHGPSGTVDCELRIAALVSSDMRSHEWIDKRSLALHEAVAVRLEAQPQLLEVARANLKRWLAARPVAALREWQRLLDSLPLALGQCRWRPRPSPSQLKLELRTTSLRDAAAPMPRCLALAGGFDALATNARSPVPGNRRLRNCLAINGMREYCCADTTR